MPIAIAAIVLACTGVAAWFVVDRGNDTGSIDSEVTSILSIQKKLSSCIKDGQSLNVQIVNKLDIMLNGVVSHVNEIKPYDAKDVELDNCSEIHLENAHIYSTNSYDLVVSHTNKGLILGLRNTNEGESNFNWWSYH